MTKDKTAEIKIDDLWNKVLDFLYVRHEYVEELERLLVGNGLNKEGGDVIVDASAGGGFPGLDLSKKGYNIFLFDGSRRMKELFETKMLQRASEELRLRRPFSPQPMYEVATWDELYSIVEGNAKVLLCRGNSLIYAGGSWGKSPDDFDASTARKAIQKALKGFYACLEPKGILYVDKFHKNEVPREATKGEIEIDEVRENLLWRVEHNTQQHYRVWTLIRERASGERVEYPNKGYLLGCGELKEMLIKAGFKRVEEQDLKSEKNFTVMLAYK